jgi:hypothetical protein
MFYRFCPPESALRPWVEYFLGCQLSCWYWFDYWTFLIIKPSLTDKRILVCFFIHFSVDSPVQGMVYYEKKQKSGGCSCIVLANFLK